MSQISRRSVLKGAAGAAAAGAVAVGSKRSKAFAAPAVLKQSGPIEVLYWGAFADALARPRPKSSRCSMIRRPMSSSTTSSSGTYEETRPEADGGPRGQAGAGRRRCSRTSGGSSST